MAEDKKKIPGGLKRRRIWIYFGIATLILLCAAIFVLSAGEGSLRKIESLDGKVSIMYPAKWSSRIRFDAPTIKIALQSQWEGADDGFRENIVVLSDPLQSDISTDAYIDAINAKQKQLRPDFAVLESSETEIDRRRATRLVCRMTFAGFVSRNIQYVVRVEDIAYTITASMPEKEYARWQPTMDRLARTVRFKS